MSVIVTEKEQEQVFVSLDVVWQGAAGKFDARVSEISMTGCFIESMGQEVMGETINFNVLLPSGIWVTLQGEVIYQEYPIGFEVCFSNLSDDKQRLLTEVVAAHGGKQAQQILEEEEKYNAAQISTLSGRVLVADDDPMTLEMVKTIIETEGYEVVCASDGHEAFRVLEQDANFSAAVFDMMMPHLDGLGLIRYVKRNDRLHSIPVGMITAEPDPKIWNDSAAAGASVFLPKPFTPQQIKTMLHLLVNKNDLGTGSLTIPGKRY